MLEAALGGALLLGDVALSLPTTTTRPSSSAMATAQSSSPATNQTALPSKDDFFGVDNGMLLRGLLVGGVVAGLLLLYFCARCCRGRGRGGDVRRYDILSAKQLQPDLVLDSEEDDDDDLFSHQPHKAILPINGK